MRNISRLWTRLAEAAVSAATSPSSPLRASVAGGGGGGGDDSAREVERQAEAAFGDASTSEWAAVKSGEWRALEPHLLRLEAEGASLPDVRGEAGETLPAPPGAALAAAYH